MTYIMQIGIVIMVHEPSANGSVTISLSYMIRVKYLHPDNPASLPNV